MDNWKFRSWTGNTDKIFQAKTVYINGHIMGKYSRHRILFFTFKKTKTQSNNPEQSPPEHKTMDQRCRDPKKITTKINVLKNTIMLSK